MNLCEIKTVIFVTIFIIVQHVSAYADWENEEMMIQAETTKGISKESEFYYVKSTLKEKNIEILLSSYAHSKSYKIKNI